MTETREQLLADIAEADKDLKKAGWKNPDHRRELLICMAWNQSRQDVVSVINDFL